MATRKNVTKGAHLLDDHWPGWASKIDLNKLKMVSNKLCILGQLATHKGTTAEKLTVQYGIAGDSVALHGFEGDEDIEKDAKLADLWRDEVKKRLAVANIIHINELDGAPKKPKKKTVARKR